MRRLVARIRRGRVIGCCALLLGLTQPLPAQVPDTSWDVTKPRGTPARIDFNTSEGTWMSTDITADGQWIVFNLLSHINGQSNIWLMDLNGGNPRPVTSDTNARYMEPTWSPDGRFLVARKLDAVKLLDSHVRRREAPRAVGRDGSQGLHAGHSQSAPMGGRSRPPTRCDGDSRRQPRPRSHDQSRAGRAHGIRTLHRTCAAVLRCHYPARPASLVVLDADPLENIRNSASIRYVLKAGVLYDAESLDELWPRQRSFGDYYWHVPDMYRSDVRPIDYHDHSPQPTKP